MRKTFSKFPLTGDTQGSEDRAPPRAPVSTTQKQMLIACAYAIGEVCCMDMEIRIIRGRVFSRAKDLLAASVPPTPELIRELYGPGGWWVLVDWRGAKGDRPTPENILETWKQANSPEDDAPHAVPQEARDLTPEERRRRYGKDSAWAPYLADMP